MWGKNITPFMLLVAATLLLAATTGTNAQRPDPGDSTEYYLEHEGQNRSFVVYTPSTLNPNEPAPLVLTIHFLGGAPELMSQFTYMNEVAEENQFLVVYPRGTDRSFNAGPICCGNDTRDDVAFLRKVLAEVAVLRNVNTKRIYSTGQSNGGYMSYRLSCDATELFAAIAPVAGSSPWPINAFGRNCLPSRTPLSILAFHGTDDALVSYELATETIGYWLDFNNCALQPTTVTFRNGVTTCESFTAQCDAYPNGALTNITLCSSAGEGYAIFDFFFFFVII